jgi:hypothetical protein
MKEQENTYISFPFHKTLLTNMEFKIGEKPNRNDRPNIYTDKSHQYYSHSEVQTPINRWTISLTK